MSSAVSFWRAAALALIAGMAAACSSAHPYKNAGPENLHIATDVRSGTAILRVFEAEDKCSRNYQGTVELSERNLQAGLPVNKQSYLVFIFEGGSNYLTGYHTIAYDLYLTPRPGYRYDAEVSYVEGVYGVTIYERDTHGGRRKIPRIEPGC